MDTYVIRYFRKPMDLYTLVIIYELGLESAMIMTLISCTTSSLCYYTQLSFFEATTTANTHCSQERRVKYDSLRMVFAVKRCNWVLLTNESAANFDIHWLDSCLIKLCLHLSISKAAAFRFSYNLSLRPRAALGAMAIKSLLGIFGQRNWWMCRRWVFNERLQFTDDVLPAVNLAGRQQISNKPNNCNIVATAVSLAQDIHM